MTLTPVARDRIYTRCANAITDAGLASESLFLARLALMLFEEVGDEARCIRAIEAALNNVPEPSLSALTPLEVDPQACPA